MFSTHNYNRGSKMKRKSLTIESKNLSDDQYEVLDTFINESGGSSKALIRIANLLIENAQRKGNRSAHDHIHEKVQSQMKLNVCTKETIKVKDSKTGNMIDVKYEQRAFTAKFIMKLAECNQKSAIAYLEQHEQEIAQHHKEVLGVVTEKEIDFFNRRVGRASAREEKIEDESIAIEE